MAGIEDRRRAIIQGIYEYSPPDIEPWQDPVEVALDALVAYFATNELVVADAIRFGTEQVTTGVSGQPIFQIVYPPRDEEY